MARTTFLGSELACHLLADVARCLMIHTTGPSHRVMAVSRRDDGLGMHAFQTGLRHVALAGTH